MVKFLTAVQFTRFMTSGATSPALFNCEDEYCQAAGDYVLKLRGFIQRTGSLRELLGTKLAAHFELPVPEPAIITLEQPLADLITLSDPSKAHIINGSVGLNFGSKEAIGHSVWPVDRSIPAPLWETARNIFAFDALVQNADRSFANPNLFVCGDDVLIFDHEKAFSFLLDVLPSPAPWLMNRQQYLTNHVFYRQLKSQDIDLKDFTRKLTGLTDATLDQMIAESPAEWNNEDAQKIAQHLRAVRNHAEEFTEDIRRFLI